MRFLLLLVALGSAGVLGLDVVHHGSSSGRTSISAMSSDIYDGCGDTKGCFGSPNGCVELGNCDMMASYLGNASTLAWEIYGRNKFDLSNFYVAIGFSADKLMGDDCVVECVVYKSEVKAFMSSNYGQQNKRDTTVSVDLLEGRIEDDVVYCSVETADTLIVGSNGCNLRTPQHILLATGSATVGHTYSSHRETASSSEPIDFQSSFVARGSSGDVWIQLHGALMIIAWLFCSSVGGVCARYFKPILKQKVLDKDLWFTVHQGTMVTAWVLTLVAFVVIFLRVDGWSTYTAHAVVGCITTAATFVQPIMATLRPPPGTPNRLVFYWAHSLVGHGAHVLAVACMFLSVYMSSAKVGDWLLYVLIAYVVVYVCVHGAMMGVNVLKRKKACRVLFVGYTVVVLGLTVAAIVAVAGN